MNFFRRFTLPQLHSEKTFLLESIENSKKVLKYQRKALRQVRKAIKEKT